MASFSEYMSEQRKKKKKDESQTTQQSFSDYMADIKKGNGQTNVSPDVGGNQTSNTAPIKPVDFSLEEQELDSLTSLYTKASELSSRITQIDNRPKSAAIFQDDVRWNKEKERLQSELDILLDGYGSLGKLRTLVQTKNQQLKLGKLDNKITELASVVDESDFFKYADYDFSVNDDLYAFINNLNNAQKVDFEVAPYYNNAQPMSSPSYGAMASAPVKAEDNVEVGLGEYTNKGYHLLNKAEKSIFNYYWAKNGKKKALEWLDSIQIYINDRMATEKAENMEGDVVKQILFGTSAGLDQFSSGITGFGNAVEGDDEVTIPSVTQMTSAKVREDMSGVGQVAYDLATTTGNMLPSILTSSLVSLVNPVLGAGVGAATMGASAGGNAYQEMINNGYDVNQARTYGILVGSSEAALQYALGGITKLSGGSGGVFGNLAKKALPQLENGLARFAVQYGANMLDEGLEESLQEILDPIFQRMVGNPDAEVDWGEVAYSGLLGMLSSGTMESVSIPGAVKNYKKGIDPITGLTTNEKKVVDKVYETKLAEAEKDGKLTQTAKDELYKKVVEDMGKGYISTDIIEEVLGGKSYKAYKDVVDSEDSIMQEYDALKKEFDAIDSKMWRDRTEEEWDRHAELEDILADMEAKIKDIEANSQRKSLKEQLSKDVFDMVKKNDRLRESYLEPERAKQTLYVAEDRFRGTKHEDAAKQTVENAIKAGANNTNRVRDFVEMIAQTSADTGLVYDFASDEEVKQAFIERQTKRLEGLEQIPTEIRTQKQSDQIKNIKELLEQVEKGEVWIDGDITGNRIVLNLDSPKPVNRVIGHEVTHSLEKAKKYKKLRKAIFAYAIDKGVDIDKRLAELQAKYAGVEDANPEAELVADLVGDYLFTDKEFIKQLSTKHRNLFEYLYDQIKYFYKIAVAGSQEARELEKVKKIFEDAYRQSGGKAQSGTKHSITEAFVDSNGTRFENAVLLDTDFFDGISPRNWGDKLKEQVYERASTDPFILPILDENGNTTILQFASPTDRVQKDDGANHKVLNELSSTSDNISKLAVVHIDEIVSVSEENSPYYSNENKHQWLDQNGWLHRNANVINQKNGNIYNLTIDIAKSADGRTILYATHGKIKKVGNVDVNSLKIKGSRQNSNFDDNVAQEEPVVKTDYSLTMVEDVQPTSDKWHRGAYTDDVRAAHPTLYAVDEDATETRNPTQISGTVKTYRKVYSHLQAEGFDGTILDASSGLGLGTQAGIDEFGFNVEDIEPYPDKDYNPKYTDYSTLNKKYDVIISNAVLNVIPQDQRDALVVKMGELLNDGGRMFVNVRGKDVLNSTGKIAISEENMEYFIPRTAKTGSYQKGFTPSELRAYLEDALGDGYEVVDGRSVFGNSSPSAIVTKKGNTSYSLSKDSDGNQLSDGQVNFFKDSKARDANGNLLKVYHTTNADFTVFDKSKKGETTGDYNTYLGFFFADTPEYMNQFPEFENGKTETYYLNMKNPIDMNNISKQAFLDIVEATGGDVQEAAELYDSEYEAEVKRAKFRGDNSTIMEMSRLLEDLTGEYFDYAEFYNALKPNYERLMSKGYDGIINSLDGRGFANEYIVLDSNQAKLTSNLNPTADQDTRYSLSSIANTFFGDENMTAEQFRKVDYRTTQGYKDYVDQCLDNYRQTRADFDEATARKAIEDSIEGIIRVAEAAKRAGYDIYDDATKRNTKDSKKRLLFSSLEPNSDYLTSNDISTICDKRQNFADIYDDIVRAEEAKGVPVGKRFFDNVDNYFYIHKLLADKGLTQPCRQCYVESMRKNLAPMASAFLRLVNETDPNNRLNDQLYQQSGKNKGEIKVNNAATREWVLEKLAEYDMTASDLNVETLTTAEGLAQLKIQAPLIYEAFNSFYGQSKPKMPKPATPFRFGELTALLTDEKGRIKKSLVDKINSTGGFRLQSYSDFQIQNYTDTLQALFEAGTLGLRGHAYTKVPAFLDATANTNLKRNISIFMYKDGNEWKLDRNDSFPYSLEEIYDIVNADKTGNTGIIAVSQNKDMSAWIMANDNVGYGIPFHKSGLKMNTVRDTIVKTEDGREVKGYSGTKDHTKQQTEVWAKTTEDHKALTKVKKGINIYSFWDFDNKSNLSKNELIEKNVKAYIDACEMAGYLPKFREYVTNNSDVLNNVLTYAKQLGFASQDATIADISFEYKGYTIPYGYYKFLGDFGMFTPDGNASPQQVLSLENYDFDKAVQFFADSETLRRNEILQQFANGEERRKYRDSDMTAEELSAIVQQKRKEIVDDVTSGYSISNADDQIAPTGDFDVYGRDLFPIRDDIAPVDIAPAMEAPASEATVAPAVEQEVIDEDESAEEFAPIKNIKTTNGKLQVQLENRKTELANVERLRAEAKTAYDEKIAKTQATLDGKKDKNTKVANRLKKRIERLQRLKADIDATYEKRIYDIQKRIEKTSAELDKDHTEKDRYAQAVGRIDALLAHNKAELEYDFGQRKAEMERKTADKTAYITNLAKDLYNELRGLKKGVRSSARLGSLLDAGFDWGNLKSALTNVMYTPGETVNVESREESAVRQLINESYEEDVNSIDDLDIELAEEIHKLEVKADEDRSNARTATQRRAKMTEHTSFWESLLGDTSTWKDMKLGLSYKTKTLRRILRNVVKDVNGNPDYGKADAIYDALETKYDHNEALLKRESNRLKEAFKKLNLNHAEDTYAHMLGELRYNPSTTLSEDVVNDFYNRHKNRIDTAKVDQAIEEARHTFDELLVRLNEALREQGMKEIPYRQGYFPHFTNPKQGWLAKLFNWKTIDNEIPTSIAGITETFTPDRSWQSFNKQRKGDTTDYSLYQGLDTYIHGALDWIYHIDDLQSRRSLENYIRYIHSDEGVKAKIEAIKESEILDADETQAAIDAVLKEARNPLGGLVRELMNRTNTLANKKSSMDRQMEDATNRKVYSVMTNLNSRVNANVVVGSFSAALANFIPITQSWMQVSPYYTLRGLGDYIRSVVRNDGVVEKSDYLTNRLVDEEKLFQTGWDKVTDKAAFMMNVIDSIASQTVWRSKYLQNLKEGMSESEAIADADQFAKNLQAGRSRGNQPTIFDAKNPLVRAFTAFQLEVANQYGYMFKDVPQDTPDTVKAKVRLVKGYATAFLGAHLYNAVYSSLVGRDVAFDPIGIIGELLAGLFGDDDEEEEEAILGFAENIVQELPFVGGLFGGGRIPLSSAFPYANDTAPLQSFVSDLDKGWNDGDWIHGDWTALTKEVLKPLYYLAMPVGGGQLKKTFEGLSMFDEDHPIAGSYTDSGALRYPVEDTFGNKLQAALFGQWSSQNAQDYFDSGSSPLKDKQINEFIDLDIPIQDYWKIRKEMAKYKTTEEKIGYINGLNLPTWKKNILANNVTDRKEPIDLEGYDLYGSLDEFDFAKEYPDKYFFFRANDITYDDYANADEDGKRAYNWAYENQSHMAVSKAVTGDFMTYYQYRSTCNDFDAKDSNGNSVSGLKKERVEKYINGLDLDYGQKIILYRTIYDSKEAKAKYNGEILEYLNSRDDISYGDKVSILTELDFVVDANGNVRW